MKNDVPKRRILKDIRNGYDSNSVLDRTALITMQDLRNIKMDYNLRDYIPNYPEDAVSLHLEVQKMKQWPKNPILFYKEQHIPDAILSEKEFTLIIMTEF